MVPNFNIYEHLLNLPNLKIQRLDFDKHALHIYCEVVDITPQKCPVCQQKTAKKTPKYRRKIQDLSISGRRVFLHLLVHQYHCECGRTFSEQFEFVQPGKSYTKRQAKWVFEMSAKQSYTQVAALLDMCAKTVERICYNQVANRTINWTQIKRIGMDEFAFKKGHKDFIVILVDLDTHEIIDLLEFRDKSFLCAYFKGLGAEVCAKVTDFCSDMWGPFQDLAAETFPNALVHVDRFHWTVYLNKIVDDCRKELRRENKTVPAFKKLKWCLIKRAEKLNAKEKKRLTAAFKLSPELEELYEMKNTFQAIFDTHFSYDFATQNIAAWMGHAKMLNSPHLTNFIAFFERHKTNILNYFHNRVTSAVVEGKNNLLRTIKRYTFNMSNFTNFKQRVFAFNQ